MNGLEFEHWVASLFRRRGYTVSLTANSGDHGIDLVLSKAGHSTVAQCKRWTDPVGEPVLRDFYGAMMNAGIENGIVVATSTFTDSAVNFVKGKPIRLIDIDELLLLGVFEPSAHSLQM